MKISNYQPVQRPEMISFEIKNHVFSQLTIAYRINVSLMNFKVFVMNYFIEIFKPTISYTVNFFHIFVVIVLDTDVPLSSEQV